MTGAHPANSTFGASEDKGVTAARGLAQWLCLAATPTFALLAFVTGILGGSPMDRLCSSGHWAPLNAMGTMYLLMSVFHLPPWLNLIKLACRGRPRPKHWIIRSAGLLEASSLQPAQRR